ncbi:MAG: NADH-quinone oxidoreductase subunit N [Deltaproteobacteria bacterium]|nr:NADH-quinone oxidoreductase subunit N [Deltaproteobacteria bacterium]
MDLSELFKSTLLIGPEIALIITGIIVMVVDPLIKGERKRNLFWIALVGLAVGFILNLERFHNGTSAFSGALSLDGFAAYFNLIFIIGAFLATILSKDYIESMNLRIGEYYALIIFSTSGMMILSSAREFMSLFLGFEIMSVSVYVLSGFNRRSVRSAEAGIKYLVLGGFSSAILLYGIALIYGASGTIFLDEIAANFNASNPLYLAGTALILTGFIFKIGAFPLHQWVPDIYEGAPVTVTGFMSVGVKAAAFAILLRVLFEGFSGIEANWMQALWIVSAFTMTIGNLAAIVQTSIKRMLAYSSIAHAGYALVGVVASYGGKELGLSSVMYYLFAYMVMNLGAFGVLAYLSKDGKECETFDDISGIWRRKPLTAIALGIFMFSLAGIPPTIGFFAKYRVFLSAVKAEFFWLAIIGILNSVISAYYYLRVLVYAYMREESVVFPRFKPTSVVALTILTIGTLLLGILPLNSWDLAIKAAGSFLLTFGAK